MIQYSALIRDLVSQNKTKPHCYLNSCGIWFTALIYIYTCKLSHDQCFSKKQNKTKRRKREREFGTWISSSSARPASLTRRGAAGGQCAAARPRAARSSDPVRPRVPASRVPRRRRPGARHVRCRRWCSSGQQGAVSARSARPRLPPPRTRPRRLPSICTSASSGEASPALGAQSVARILEKEMINVNTVCPTPHTSASSGAMFLPATR